MRDCGCERDPVVFGHDHQGEAVPWIMRAIWHAPPGPAMTLPIYDQVAADLARLFDTDPLPSAPADPPEDAVSLTTFEADMKADLQHLEDGVRAFAEKHLPLAAEAASLADRAVSTKLAQTAMEVVLPPDIEAGFVAAIKAVDAKLKAEQAAETPAAPDDSDQPADTAPEAPSAPVVGGQAR